VEQTCQAAVEFPGTTNNSSCRIHDSLKPVSNGPRDPRLYFRY